MIIDRDPLALASPFVAYSYAYPHKSAYRPFEEPLPLAAVWQNERQDSLFLYIHIPFCEYRCGFCNLFTLANAEAELPRAYLAQVRREAAAARSALPDGRFTRVAIGGGTPTYLDEIELAQLADIIESELGVSVAAVPSSCEASPATLTAAKAQWLRDWGVERLSLGVQTFDDAESRALGRPQRAAEVRAAIELARHAGFSTLNLDLIYGGPSQSIDSWRRSLAEAISFEAEEIYLYPLYVRELTGLGRTAVVPSDGRLDAYRAGRDMLLDAGYEQVSLRMFRRPAVADAAAPVYCCQSDGMVGIGCGARSYTRELHYSTEFAVGCSGVRSILRAYLDRDRGFFDSAHYGVRLNANEQRRRYVILSLLQREGLLLADYTDRFASDLYRDLPQLRRLETLGLATNDGQVIRLTPAGIERSDAIGPWLYSVEVVELMEQFECR